jgi:hypothetical protein
MPPTEFDRWLSRLAEWRREKIETRQRFMLLIRRSPSNDTSISWRRRVPFSKRVLVEFNRCSFRTLDDISVALKLVA